MSNSTSSETGSTPPSESVTVRRGTDRADYEGATIRQIVDAALVAHVGTIRDGLPMVTPMFCVRDDDRLLLHGAPATGAVRRGASMPVCVEFTMVDGLVLARSAFHHSVNYRSVVVIGEATTITDPIDKARALELIVDRLVPGRTVDLRPTNDKESRSTAVLEVSLQNASAKVRSGGPVDDDADLGLDIWSGVVPIASVYGEPITADDVGPGVPIPANVRALVGQIR